MIEQRDKELRFIVNLIKLNQLLPLSPCVNGLLPMQDCSFQQEFLLFCWPASHSITAFLCRTILHNNAIQLLSQFNKETDSPALIQGDLPLFIQRIHNMGFNINIISLVTKRIAGDSPGVFRLSSKRAIVGLSRRFVGSSSMSKFGSKQYFQIAFEMDRSLIFTKKK